MKKVIFCLFVMFTIIFAGTSHAVSLNPGFEDPGFLSHWTYGGIVSQVSGGDVSFDAYTYNISPTEGNSMALLSAPGLSGGGSYGTNQIKQTIADFQGGEISFDYNIFSVDWRGNDRFTVKIDTDDDTYDFDWNELDGAPNPIVPFKFYYGGWQSFTHDLGSYTGSLTITVGGGNGGDDNWNTWTYVDNFSASSIPDASTLLLLASAFCLIVAGKQCGHTSFKKK